MITKERLLAGLHEFIYVEESMITLYANFSKALVKHAGNIARKSPLAITFLRFSPSPLLCFLRKHRGARKSLRDNFWAIFSGWNLFLKFHTIKERKGEIEKLLSQLYRDSARHKELIDNLIKDVTKSVKNEY